MIMLQCSPGGVLVAYDQTGSPVQFVENDLRCAARVRTVHYGYFKRLSRAADRLRDLTRADLAGQLDRLFDGNDNLQGPGWGGGV